MSPPIPAVAISFCPMYRASPLSMPTIMIIASSLSIIITISISFVHTVFRLCRILLIVLERLLGCQRGLCRALHLNHSWFFLNDWFAWWCWCFVHHRLINYWWFYGWVIHWWFGWWYFLACVGTANKHHHQYHGY